MISYSKSRLEVAKAINALTVDTPLFKCAGDIPAGAVGTTDGGGEQQPSTSTDIVQHNSSNPTSYAAIHLQLHKKYKLYSEKYAEHILKYAAEWERILTTRISGNLKTSEKLRVDLDHYAKKVEDLNKTMNKTMSKGKSVDDKGVDKLKRNEAKLVQARAEYDRFVNDLCGYMEEVLHRGWKDLHPLLVKMAQFDSTLSNEEAQLLKGSMMSVTEEMKNMGTKYPNLKPQGRLKELESMSLESFANQNPSEKYNDSGAPLLITQGGGESATYMAPLGGNSDSIHSGLVGNGRVGGGGGLFGEPAARTSSFGSDTFGMNDSSRSRTSTGDSGGYDWSTGGAGGAANTAGYARAPSSGGLPPLNPSSRSGSFAELPSQQQQRLSSGHIDLSQTSNMLSTMQAAAPPPTMNDIFSASQPSQPSQHQMMPPPAPGVAPPPPPMMPPPPPPQSMSPSMQSLSLYDGSPQRTQPQYQIPPQQQMPQQQLMNNPGFMSSQQSASSNPFDDGHSAAGGGNNQQQQQRQYGSSYGAPSNPFG